MNSVSFTFAALVLNIAYIILLQENEFFFDKATSELFLYFNASVGTAPPKDLEIEATDLQDYVKIMGGAPGRGGEEGPVTGVTIRGITIRDAGATYLEPHGMPSGGDWYIQSHLRCCASLLLLLYSFQTLRFISGGCVSMCVVNKGGFR